MFCDNCGTKLNDDDLFCPICGQKNEVAASSEQPQAPYAPPQNQMNEPYLPPQEHQQASYTPPPYQQTPAQYQQMPPQQPYGQVGSALTSETAKKKKTAIIIGIAAGSVLLLALIIFLVLHFFGGGKEEDTGKETTRKTKATTESIESGEDVPKLGLGETGVFDGLAMTVDKVTRPNAEFLYSKPDDGNEHILIWYTFENQSDEPQKTPVRSKIYIVTGEDASSDSGYEMTSYDAEAEYFTTDGEYEPAKELAPGEKTSGWLLYQKPKAIPTITIHYYSEFVNRPPDLAFKFPVELEEIDETDPTTEPTTAEPTTEETTAPVDIDLTSMLPGVWASLPTSEDYSFVYWFVEDGRVGSSFAYNESSETTLDNWDTPGVWNMDPYMWSNWRLEGGDLIIVDAAGAIRISVNVVSNDEIQLIYEGSDEPFTLYRKGISPNLYDYLIGTWVPDIPDAGGVYAALSFYIDGSAALTGANKSDETATADYWGYEEYWEVLGVVDGTWRLEGENIIISMQDSEDVYTVSINGANNCTIYFGDSWQTPYTRVAYSY
ncbi:MAG: DUF4352 domain-containing protein [Clostridiaceae bacterium]|nr:DUF4352 domain-containing protein [Clostridiaceae bacterium]